MRVTYRTLMRFSPDPASPLIRVRWYFVPEGTPLMPYPNQFAARSVWEPDKEWLDGLGEQYQTQKPQRQKQGPIAGPGQLPCGTPEQWMNGVGYPWPRRGVFVVGGYDVYVCCFSSESLSSISAIGAGSVSSRGPSLA